jgi:endonuclease YncB( thermonuclease family)
MRKALSIVAGAALLTAGGLLALVDHGQPILATAPVVPPESGGTVAPAPASEGTSTAASVDATLPPAPPLAPRPVADLPVIEVAPRAVHVVPDSDTPPPHPVTFEGSDGRPLTRQPAQPAASAPAPSPRTPTQITGAARVTDVVSLDVLGRPIQLFGVKPPQSGDRCGAGTQIAARACGDVAREALAARLRNNATVFCRVPAGQREHRSAAICTDSSGVDLGGFLVAEGLALADSTQSYDYAGAEGVARSFRRGLWRYR